MQISLVHRRQRTLKGLGGFVWVLLGANLPDMQYTGYVLVISTVNLHNFMDYWLTLILFYYLHDFFNFFHANLLLITSINNIYVELKNKKITHNYRS